MEVNNKVVCINNKPLENCKNSDLHLLNEGEIYTIEEIIDCGLWGTGIILQEVLSSNPVGFSTIRFREIDEKFGEEIIKNIENQLIEEEIFT